MKKAWYRFFCLLSSLLLLTSCTPAFSENQAPMNKSFFAMNTYNTFTVYDNTAEDVLSEAEKELKRPEALWSVTDENSEIHTLNHGNGTPFEVSEHTEELLRFAMDMAEQTEGILDITTYPVLTAWGFTTGKYQIPTEDQLAEKMALVGYKKVLLSGNTVTLPAGMEIDLGAVAKGYACDLLAETFSENGIDSAIINLGGGIRLIGTKPDGSDFKVSVQHPEQQDSLGTLELSDTSIFTSGAYQRFFVGADGEKYGHILDPRTGHPARSGVASVTIVAKEGRLCDALSTSLFVMGVEGAEQFWRKHGGFEMLLVTENGEIYLTEGLEERLALAEKYQGTPTHIIRL